MANDCAHNGQLTGVNMSGLINDSPLGERSEYVTQYAPQLLFPIKREVSRRLLKATPAEFYGVDVWTGYELSWLDAKGKPRVAIAEFFIPCESEFIVESKSFKLYLNSFNQTRFETEVQVESVLKKDLSAVVGRPVEVKLYSVHGYVDTGVGVFAGEGIDDLEVEITHYHPAPELLTVTAEQVEECLWSDLLKTNCPVTGQPDWASVQIVYRGNKISRESLLRYIVSFREHQDFHEHCVETMFTDIMAHCRPETLSIYARYTRRGGLDINPFRTTEKNKKLPRLRLVRQ
jgi:7-cyano-7-deazaguanine reductase